MRVGALNIVLGSYSFLLSIFYIPIFYNGATNTRWAWLAVVTPILLLFLDKQKFTLLHFVGSLFVLFAFVSLHWAFNLYDGLNEFLKLLILLQVFILGSRLIDLRPIFIGLAIGLTFGIFNLPKGMLVNPNILADAALLTITGLIVYKLWWFIPTVIPSFILSGSRGAIVAALVTLAAFTWNKNRLYGYLILGIAVLFVGTLFLFKIQFGGIQERLYIYEDTIRGFSFIGNGIGSFHSVFPYFSENIDTFKSRPRYAHNDLMQIVFELGIFGFALAMIFVSMLLRTNSNEKYIIFTFTILSLFSFPLYMPMSAFIFSIVAGHMSRNWCSIFDYDVSSRMVRLERI